MAIRADGRQLARDAAYFPLRIGLAQSIHPVRTPKAKTSVSETHD
jgi:hypothetical protein